jgi:phospholipid transport system substrate-binding protein
MHMAMKRFFLSLIVVCFIGPEPIFADTPTEQIQETLRQVKTIVNGSASTSEAERRELLKQALMPRFDWVDMAKQALGRYWHNVPDRQYEFVAAFAEFLGTSYVGQIGSYKDEKILFMRERIDNNLAQVETKIVPSTGAPTAVNYRLRHMQGEWKIYDVVVEDISIVANYRSQFSRILTTGSFDELLKRLREKKSDAGS